MSRKQCKPWTMPEVARLKAAYGTKPVTQLATEFGRSFNSVARKAATSGFTKKTAVARVGEYFKSRPSVALRTAQIADALSIHRVTARKAAQKLVAQGVLSGCIAGRSTAYTAQRKAG